MMKFFRHSKTTDRVRVKGLSVTRFMFANLVEVEGIELWFKNEEGDKLCLELTPRQAREAMYQLRAAYETVCPPIQGSKISAVDYMGLEN
jgi:hypothetical protein